MNAQPSVSSLVSADYFAAIAAHVCVAPAGADRVSLALACEVSDFIRFNRGRVRQSTHVTQGVATLTVARGLRRIDASLTLIGRLEDDVNQLRDQALLLAQHLDDVPDDPHVQWPEPARSHRHENAQLPNTAALVKLVTEAARGLDLVGFYAAGPIVRAFADSAGTRHWHHVESFHFDWCLYRAADQAIKSEYAGTRWNDDEFLSRVDTAAQRLVLFQQPVRHLAPGAYRAFLAPAAMNELLGTLTWGGFGARERQVGTSSLVQLARGSSRLHEDVSFCEDFAGGLAPMFSIDGFARPRSIGLIERGVNVSALTSPRSAKEFELPSTGADDDETPQALRLSCGTLPTADVLQALDTGLFVSNLWYLNYSDRPACRMTGMTRFACFWVEGGQLIAPLSVMRFDDSFLRMFGDGLLGLTDHAEMMPDASTYEQRQLRSITTPGALIEGWRLTL